MNNQNCKYYTFSIFSFILFHVPIITVYFNDVLKSVYLVSILFLVKSVTVFIFEIPTGYIADRYSRKLSLTIGIILNIFSLVLFVYKPNFYSLLLSEVFFGLSECLTSGSDSAFYYDNFNAEGRSTAYNSFVKNIGFIQSIFLSLSFFIGSVLYGFNSKIVFISTVLCQIIALLVLYTIKEHPYKKTIEKKINIKDEIKLFIQDFDKSIFCILIIYSSILAIFSSLYLQLFPLITSEMTNNYYLYGSIYVLVMMTYGFGAKRGNENISILPKLLLVLLTTILVGIVVNNTIYILLIVIVTRFIWGYISTGLNIYINNNISDSNFRATIFSILSILTSIFSSLFMLLMGWIIDKHIGLKYIFILWSVLIIILLILSKRLVLTKGGDFNDLQQTKL